MSDESTSQLMTAASVAAAIAPVTSAPRLPFNMQPAPARARRVSPPIDLGPYDENYAGWCVVFDLDTGLDSYEKLAASQAPGTNGIESIKLMREWMEEVVLAWNFISVALDGTVSLMPQPKDGGAAACPPGALGAIASAFADSLKPAKSLGA